MKQRKIQPLSSLEEEMRSVARGEKPAPADAAQPSFNSRQAMLKRTVCEIHEKNADVSEQEIMEAVNEAVAWARAKNPNL